MNRNWMYLFIILAIAKAAGVRGDESIHSSTRKAYSIESNTSIVKLDEKHDMEKHGMFRHRKQQRVNLFDDSFMSTGDVDENRSKSSKTKSAKSKSSKKPKSAKAKNTKPKSKKPKGAKKKPKKTKAPTGHPTTPSPSESPTAAENPADNTTTINIDSILEWNLTCSKYNSTALIDVAKIVEQSIFEGVDPLLSSSQELQNVLVTSLCDETIQAYQSYERSSIQKLQNNVLSQIVLEMQITETGCVHSGEDIFNSVNAVLSSVVSDETVTSFIRRNSNGNIQAVISPNFTSSSFAAVSNCPTSTPTHGPSSTRPTSSPSSMPSTSPTIIPSSNPSLSPSVHPSINPSRSPTSSPMLSPSACPSSSPSRSPSIQPSPTAGTSDWKQIGDDIIGEATYDEFGGSVSLSADGKTVAIGAPFNGGSGSTSGHTRIYRWTEDSWTQLGPDLDGEAGDRFGQSVSLSSDGYTVAIGAPSNDGNGDTSGCTRVYRWDETSWNQLGDDIVGEYEADYSGSSVSLSEDGNIVAIGAEENYNNNGDESGHVRVYKWNGSSWSQLGSDIDGESNGDRSGRSVSLSLDGSIVAIGAPYNDGVNGYRSGHVRVYSFDGLDWKQMGSDIEGENAGDFSCYASLCLDGNTVAIGAPSNNDNATFHGHVRIYSFDGEDWSQVGEDIDGDSNEQSGSSVSLSSDGNKVAIGSWNANIDGYSIVRVYKYDGITWEQFGSSIEGIGDTDYEDYWAVETSVSLSSDGKTVAVGSPYHTGSNGNYTGRVRIFSISTD